MNNVKIKKAVLDDLTHLHDISRKTFCETFAKSNTEENMSRYLKDNFSIEVLTKELKNKYSEFYFALLDSKVVGYLKLNFGNAQTEIQDKNGFEIERIYVLQEFHGKKVGQILFEKAMDLAKQINIDYVWLGVWEENLRAINFYKKNGFVEFDKHIFKLGEDEQTDILMKKSLKALHFPLRRTFENEQVILYPLLETDFDALYKVAADPKIWEQHPNKDRWKKEVFKSFFEGAIQSGTAFKIIDKQTGDIIGSTRFYDYNEKEGSIFIGYTFYATAYWGKGINSGVKIMMLNYLFNFVSTVRFHIGASNIRSQIAISRIGAEKIGEQEVAYFGEASKLNFVYEIRKEKWEKSSL